MTAFLGYCIAQYDLTTITTTTTTILCLENKNNLLQGKEVLSQCKETTLNKGRRNFCTSSIRAFQVVLPSKGRRNFSTSSKCSTFTMPSPLECYNDLRNKSPEKRDEYFDNAGEELHKEYQSSLKASENVFKEKNEIDFGLSQFTGKPKRVAEPDLRPHL